MENQINTGPFYGRINAVILFFLYFCLLGFVFYGFSVIFPQMVKTMGWNRGHAALPHSLRGLMVGILAPLVSYSINKIGSKKTFLIGLSTSLVSLILLGTITTTLWHWTIIWGVAMPIGFAFAGQMNVQTTTLFWFNKNRATAMGFVMSGAALAGFLASPVLTWLMKQTHNWQTGWLACAGIVIISIIALHWLENKPADIGQFPDGIDPKTDKKTGKDSENLQLTHRTSENWELRDAIQTRVIWLDILLVVALLMSLYLLLVHGVFHLTDIGYTKMNAASVISAMLMGGVFSRLPMGFAGDRIEPRWILTLAFLIMLPAMMIIWKAPGFTLLIVAGFSFGFGFGTVITINPILLGNYFGPDAFPSINGFIQPVSIPFAAVVPFSAGYIKEYYGNYDFAFIFIGCLLGLGLLASALMVPPVKAKIKLSESKNFLS
ncbi:MAG: MFS transporter [Desulfobacteraceae bacterium]|nr:MFS transporter [Desulfobacteraceae bacterium]